MATIYIHNEYWDGRTGREIVLAAARAASFYIVDETVHVYTPDMLNYSDDQCEASIWWSVRVKDGFDIFDVVDAIRSVKIRVKDAGNISDEFARCTIDELWAETQRIFDEQYADYD